MVFNWFRELFGVFLGFGVTTIVMNSNILFNILRAIAFFFSILLRKFAFP